MEKVPSKPKGRPPASQAPAITMQEEGEYLVLRVPKKIAASLLLKDLLN